jgi:hypothetical protein
VDEQRQPTPAEPAEATTEEQAPPADAQPEVAAEQPSAEAPVFDLGKALDEAPAEVLRRHPKFAGLVGSEKQRWQAEYATQQQAKAEAEARARAEEELRLLAEQNPVAFADKWLSSEQARQQQERLTQLEHNARQAIGSAIGAGMHTIPEWAEVAADPTALAQLAAALQGKEADEVLPAWNAAALELVATRRAAALAEKQLEERLKAERAAWETEASGRGLASSDRPGLGRGGRASSADPEPDFRADPVGYEAWYVRNTPGAQRTLRRG